MLLCQTRVSRLLILALTLCQSVCWSRSGQLPSATTIAVCNRVRFFPRAGFATRMVGGRFQGSNVGPTSDFTNLATITAAPSEGKWSELIFPNNVAYKYLRYYAPAGSYGNVADLEFYHNETRLTGKPFGTYGSRNNSGDTFQKVFDGDTSTFFDAPLPNDQYVGIALTVGETTGAPAPTANGKGRRHYHVGNSLTDTEGELTQAIARQAGFADDFFDRQTIPGSPLRVNWEAKSGFGTPYLEAFVKDAPLDDLVLQTFIQNGDSDDPTYSAKFYDLARQKSPHVRVWVYGQWAGLGSEIPTKAAPPDWEAQTRGLMDVYAAHAINLQAVRPDAHPQVIPGGLALINLKHAIDSGRVPGMTGFFASTFADGLHLNGNGRYFIGLVHYACLYGRSPVGALPVSIPGVTVSMTPAQARIYQQIAWDTVTQFTQTPQHFIGATVPGEIDARAYIGATPPFENPYVRYIPASADYDYLLAAPTSGSYLLRVSVGAATTGKKLEVLVNGKAAGTLDVPVTGPDDNTLGDTPALPLSLHAGLNLVRLHVPKDEDRPYNLNSLKFTRADGTGLTHSLPMMGGFQFYSRVNVAQGVPFTQGFTVNDTETPPSALVVTAASDNTALVPAANIVLTRDTKDLRNISFTVTPATDQTGQARITFTVKNRAKLTRATSFLLTVK